MIPFHIADYSATFFAVGRGFTVGSDSANFIEIRRLLTSGEGTVDQLVELADPRIALAVASNGLCTVVGNSVMFEGMELHGVWVEKILAFKANDLPFDPIMLALADLQKNPGEKARSRLPVFVEQSKLGFLPDGRIAALKYVSRDYTDCHSGTYSNKVGDTPSMERSDVDANPDNECSSGLHLGAYDYVTQYYDSSKRIMLCAFWPSDVVAVPRDYNGQKMRVSKYEVLEEMDLATLRDFVFANSNLLRSYQVTMPAESSLDVAIEAVVEDHTDYPRSDWQYEVSNGDTKLGYAEWLEHKLEAEDEDERASPVERVYVSAPGVDRPEPIAPAPILSNEKPRALAADFVTTTNQPNISSADGSMRITQDTMIISDRPKRKYVRKPVVAKKAVKKKVAAKKALPAKKVILKKKAAPRSVATMSRSAPHPRRADFPHFRTASRSRSITC